MTLTCSTYKYIHGAPEYDTKRAPAYTDRILFRSPLYASALPSSASTPGPSTPGAPSHQSPLQLQLQSKPTCISCNRYGSHDVQWSDHRPVSGSYSTTIRVPDREKRAQVMAEIKRELERLEIVYKPSVEIDRKEVDLGSVPYVASPCTSFSAWSIRRPVSGMGQPPPAVWWRGAATEDQVSDDSDRNHTDKQHWPRPRQTWLQVYRTQRRYMYDYVPAFNGFPGANA